jgi:hypothetical protein
MTKSKNLVISILALILILFFAFCIFAYQVHNIKVDANKIKLGQKISMVNGTHSLFKLEKTTSSNKNNILIFPEGIQAMNASDVLRMNGNISVIQYYDNIQGKFIFYFRIHGGIGKNFKIEPGVVYYICTGNDTNLTLKLS